MEYLPPEIPVTNGLPGLISTGGAGRGLVNGPGPCAHPHPRKAQLNPSPRTSQGVSPQPRLHECPLPLARANAPSWPSRTGEGWAEGQHPTRPVIRLSCRLGNRVSTASSPSIIRAPMPAGSFRRTSGGHGIARTSLPFWHLAHAAEGVLIPRAFEAHTRIIHKSLRHH